MKIIKVTDQQAGGKAGFEIFKEALANGATTFGLATGSTPVTTYAEIVASDLDFSNATSINLDEYVGLAADHDQSYHYFMNEHLFSKKPFAQSFLPDGLATDLDAFVKEYHEIIESHPIDLQILGIGQNGHIGFNEPGTSFTANTHVVDLTDSTIEANSRFFASRDEVPAQAISMGIAEILQSKQIIVEAFGKNKAEAIKKMVEGPITEDVPASVLQKHNNVVVIVDEEAASLLA
ncbi:glucosamine-6-phosphate deaminase [Periweissella fabaria]|uniref:Glucosamine-6-phosphate deaminase n=1 Tax=Periweissella fabaria TaxID=546157 RepID=A0ABM8Z9B6_9LACO|nr:glucosamine-6-phosphate deaminase [Periweissella fabaria]MCM0597959.1 glucosamine-6-phosphate deaminase [Periweissella fabaria]CAH0417440.1 Glucosamine-6-phosphate deaminase [Periweissella fabaria]